MVINADLPRGVAAAVFWPVVLAVLTALVAAPAAATALETRTLSVGEFDRVFFRGAGTVRLSQGATPRLTVRGHDALVEQVTVATRDGELHIDTPPTGRHLVLELTVAELVAFTSAGDGRIVGDDLRFDALTLEGSGAGSFDMQRLVAHDFEVRGRGATHFRPGTQPCGESVRHRRLPGGGADQRLRHRAGGRRLGRTAVGRGRAGRGSRRSRQYPLRWIPQGGAAGVGHRPGAAPQPHRHLTETGNG